MRRGGCRGMGERSSAQEEIAITCFLYLDQERNKRSCLSSYGVISTLAHAPRQRVARADRPKGDRPSRRVDGLARGQAARPREQMVAPREELVLGAGRAVSQCKHANLPSPEMFLRYGCIHSIDAIELEASWLRLRL